MHAQILRAVVEVVGNNNATWRIADPL